MNSASSSSGVIRHGPYPELTWASILVGYFLGVIIAISIGYAALILGFSIEGSELAAILGFGILRGILRRNSIIENNIAQTVASAVNGASSGMMFSVPAIFILGYGSDFNPVLLTFGAIAGAFLGIGFIIPLRKQMIDYERLTYPGGVAVATILKSPGAGIHKAMLLIGGALALTAAAAHGEHHLAGGRFEGDLPAGRIGGDGDLEVGGLARVLEVGEQRLLVLAPTEVTQGASAGEPIVVGAGPLLPAEVATKTPASRAARKAKAVSSVQGSRLLPPME